MKCISAITNDLSVFFFRNVFSSVAHFIWNYISKKTDAPIELTKCEMDNWTDWIQEIK